MRGLGGAGERVLGELDVVPVEAEQILTAASGVSTISSCELSEDLVSCELSGRFDELSERSYGKVRAGLLVPEVCGCEVCLHACA